MTTSKTETTTRRTLAAELIERYMNRHGDDGKTLFREWFNMNARQLDDVISGRMDITRFVPLEDIEALAGQLEYTGNMWDLLYPRKPRRRAPKLSREAYREQQRQRHGKLCARVEMPQRELDEYATGKRPLRKTTADATTVYVTEGYVLHHGVFDRHHYFVDWRRGENSWDPRCELGRGIFSSDEDAIDYLLNVWSKSHRAYVPEPVMADTVPGPEETAAPTDIEDETIAAATTEETEAHYEDTSDIATSGQTAECESRTYVRPALCAEGRGRTALGRGIDLRNAIDCHDLLALAY